MVFHFRYHHIAINAMEGK